MDIQKLPSYIFLVLVVTLPTLILVVIDYSFFHLGLFMTSAVLGVFGTVLFKKATDERNLLSEEVASQTNYIQKASEEIRKLRQAAVRTEPREIKDPNLEFRVYHSGFLNLRLLEECERSRRYQRPFSCLVISIDGYEDLFKQHADLNGELLGLEFAKFIKQNLRWVDIVIRKSDAYVIAILPETASAGAAVTAERLRFRVDRTTFPIEHVLLKLTVTINFLTYDRMIHLGNEQVMQALDRMAADAKSKGPNKVLDLNK